MRVDTNHIAQAFRNTETWHEMLRIHLHSSGVALR